MPLHRSNFEAPRSSQSSHSTNTNRMAPTFSSVNGRPFGAALGLDAPDVPRSSASEAMPQADEQLFTIKVEPVIFSAVQR